MRGCETPSNLYCEFVLTSLRMIIKFILSYPHKKDHNYNIIKTAMIAVDL